MRPTGGLLGWEMLRKDVTIAIGRTSDDVSFICTMFYLCTDLPVRWLAVRQTFSSQLQGGLWWSPSAFDPVSRFGWTFVIFFQKGV
mmetsp:Transcript_15677/g.34071  ORF Transcript_15677/g.34071 Transcript_15677/m.34071 type:complete len:86 (-) Transcript_15677:516-773(-)